MSGNQHLEGYDDWAVRLQLLFKPSDTFNGLLNVHTRWLGGSARLFRANVMSQGSNALIPGFDPATIFTDGYNGQSYTSIGSNLHRSEEHTSELQSLRHLVCRLLLEKKK